MHEINHVSEQWFALAKGDKASAEHLLSLYPLRLEVICYLCEQSVEKLLKGFLSMQEVVPPRTHDLMKLCRMCSEYNEQFNDVLEACSNLNPYGVQVRYPNNIELIESDMHEALRDMQKVDILLDSLLVE